MIVKTFLIFAILSFVGKSKGLMDFEDFDVDVIFEKYNLSCHIGINRYIQRKLYYDPADLKATNKAYKDKIDEIITTYFNLLRVYYIPCTDDNNNIMGTIIAPEMWTEYSHMLDWKSKNDESKILKIAKKMICCICGNCDLNSENNESDVHAMAKQMIGSIFDGDFTLSDENTISTYEHCRDTFSLLTTQSIFMRNPLSNIFKNHALNETNDKLPVPMHYGFILLLVKEGEIEHFFNSDSTNQKIFIVDLMNQAIINSYDTIIKIYNGLGFINDEMWNILIEININLIDASLAVEVFCNQVYQRQRSIEVNSSSDSPEQPEYQSELIDMYNIYIVNLKAILNSKPHEFEQETFLNEYPAYELLSSIKEDPSSDPPEQLEYQSKLMKMYGINIKNLEAKLKEGRLRDDNNKLSKYRGRLVKYKEYKHTIRVPVMGYYTLQPKKEEFLILPINIINNEYYGLLMELRIWIKMIQNFTNGMRDEMFDYENEINTSDPHARYLSEIVDFFDNEKKKILRQMFFVQEK